MDHARAQVSAKSPTGESLKYIVKHWEGLFLFLIDGRIKPHSYRPGVLKAIINGRKQKGIGQLLSWRFKA